jgi:2-dehydro-3-deoxygluconokinase
MIDWTRVFEGARWFHTSGISPALSDSVAETVAEAMVAAKSAGLTVSYDLNFRATLWSAERAREVQGPLMQHVDVLIAGESAARAVFGITPAISNQTDAAVFAQTAQERFGVPVVAVTLRQESRSWLNSVSSVLVAGEAVHHGPWYEVETVDRIGAGDAFAAGLIAARLRDGDWDLAIRRATAVCALKHTVPGDFSQATPGDVAQILESPGLRLIR